MDDIRPIQDRIVIRPVAAEEKTAGGIIIPDSAKERPREGVVIAVGPGSLQEDGTIRAPDVKKGDRVLYAKYFGIEVQIDGVEHLIMHEDEILGVVEE